MNQKEKLPIKTLSHELKYENHWMKVYEDKIERKSKKEGLYGIVEKEDFALIVPFDGKNIYLVEQYRYPVKTKTLEFPMGLIEKSDTSIKESALRELKEETGLTAETVQKLGSFFTAPGFAKQTGHVFLALNLTKGEASLDEEEDDLKVRSISPSDFEKLVSANIIKDSATLSAYAMLKAKGLF